MLRIFAASVVLLAAGAAGAGAQSSSTPPAAAPAKSPAAAQPAAGPQVAVLETVLGNIVIKFADRDAPKTVANFKKLVKQGFYDGTCFHRVIAGFMIQGGDPNSRDTDPGNDGMGGPGYTVPAEIKLKHVRGAVATARQGDQMNPARASSGSQFFIDVAPQPSLDQGGYTVFGRVIQGMDVVDKIVALGADPATPRGPAGPNPGKKALVRKATLEPLSKYEKPAAAAPDTTK
ncbi:MAG: peptidylprolyl isomerase [Candidatus Eisenbacteria bacterium]